MQQNQQMLSTPLQGEQKYQYYFSESAMRHYFYKPSPIYLLLLILGIFMLIIGIAVVGTLGPALLVFALIITLIGGIPFLVYTTEKPSEFAYTKWVTERSQPLYKKALQRLHLDESQCEDIIEVQGGFSSLLQLTRKFPEKEIALKRLSDGRRHYSINVCTYIFLTKDDIAIYSGYINAFAQNERFEDADHYYYKDIVGVSTSGPIYTSTEGPTDKETQRQGFFVRISNGEAIGTDYARKVALRNEENRTQIEGVDEVVAVLLSLLRDHKVTTIEADRISRDVSPN